MKSPTPSSTYLVRNRYGYCFRIKVPHDLQPLIQKKELRYSLRTGYLGLAKSRARLLAGLFQQLFRKLREPEMGSELTKQEIDDIIDNFKGMILDSTSSLLKFEADTSAKVTRAYGKFSTYSATAEVSLIANDYDWVSDALDYILDGMGYDPSSGMDKNSPQFNELCTNLLRMAKDHFETEKRLLSTDHPELELDRRFSKGNPAHEMPTVNINPSEPTSEQGGTSITLSELIDLYVQENKRADNWAPRTIPEYESIFRNILRLFGDLPLRQITKAACQTFKQHLTALPKDYFRATKKYEGMTIAQAVSKTGDSLLSVKSVNKYLERFSEVLKFGVKNGYLTSNHASGLRIKQRKRKAYEERDAFSKDDLATLFDPANYLPKTSDHSWKFWLPLLGLYTGARLEELCQLQLADIEEIDGVWILGIKSDAESGKRVKTEYSENRLVPLHPFIKEELGFIDFVEKLKSEGEQRLFPELKKRAERYGHYPGRWFGNYKTKLGFPPAKKTFHSFRHNFQDNLKQQLVPESVIDELVGHKLQGETMGRYGKPYQAKVLYEEAILKLNYDVDLSHLTKSKWVVK